MGPFFLAWLPAMRGEGMVERLAVNILGMMRQAVANRCRQIIVGVIGHGAYLSCIVGSMKVETRLRSRKKPKIVTLETAATKHHTDMKA